MGIAERNSSEQFAAGVEAYFFPRIKSGGLDHPGTISFFAAISSEKAIHSYVTTTNAGTSLAWVLKKKKVEENTEAACCALKRHERLTDSP